MYNRSYSPENVSNLKNNEIFVFGTTPNGYHKSKAALYAVEYFGAGMGRGEGFSGQSYAIPVHKHHRSKMEYAVKQFIDYAKNRPNRQFLVAAIGCGSAGMDPALVALMFSDAIRIENILLPKLFVDELRKYYRVGVSSLQRILSKTRSYKNRAIGAIAIARNFGIVLNDDNQLTLIGHNESFRQLPSPERFIKIAAAFCGYMALTEHGRIVTCGKADEFDRSWEIEQLRNVIDIAACEGHVVALFENGDVVSIDEPGGWEGIPKHNNVVKNWHNIKQIAVGFSNIMGLTHDGKVLYHSVDGYTDPHFYDKCSNVTQVDCYSHYYGSDSSAVLLSDGTVVSDTFIGVDKWTDIVNISVGANNIVGLKRNGTIEVVGLNKTQNIIKDWKDIACIECKFFGIIAITNRGEILFCFDH